MFWGICKSDISYRCWKAVQYILLEAKRATCRFSRTWKWYWSVSKLFPLGERLAFRNERSGLPSKCAIRFENATVWFERCWLKCIEHLCLACKYANNGKCIYSLKMQEVDCFQICKKIWKWCLNQEMFVDQMVYNRYV